MANCAREALVDVVVRSVVLRRVYQVFSGRACRTVHVWVEVGIGLKASGGADQAVERAHGGECATGGARGAVCVACARVGLAGGAGLALVV